MFFEAALRKTLDVNVLYPRPNQGLQMFFEAALRKTLDVNVLYPRPNQGLQGLCLRQ
ncbi:unnamed protein product, partial [Larinioides sclopetarius]